MLNQSAISIATSYWAANLGCPAAELFAEPFRIIHHGSALVDYNGVFALCRGNSAVVSIPPERDKPLRALLAAVCDNRSFDSLASALRSVATTIVGPAYIGYATSVAQPTKQAQSLGPDDAAALRALKQACDPSEWEHGGSSIERPCSGVFVAGQLVAVAGFEVWGTTIAHLSIVTHPDFRGRGFGRSAIAHVGIYALEAGLLLQYRTLESNRPSIRVAESLGFDSYATSIAVRLRPQMEAP
jgi:GNAT superfamily N-acetyltransferase